MADLTLPAAKNAGEAGHIQVHNDIRTAIAQADARLDAVEGGIGGTTDASALTTGTLNAARLPAGSIFVVDKVKNGGSWPGARPTARTDVTVIWVGDTDPGALSINGDEWDQVA